MIVQFANFRKLQYNKQMQVNLDSYKTPGQLIEDFLKDRGWTQRVLAIVIGADETSINKMITDKRPVKADMAIILAEIFDTDPNYFLELQKNFDLAQAKITSRPDPGRSTRATIFGDLPITSMIKRGWIEANSIRDKEAIELGLTKLFGVENISDIESLPHSAKKTEVFVRHDKKTGRPYRANHAFPAKQDGTIFSN